MGIWAWEGGVQNVEPFAHVHAYFGMCGCEGEIPICQCDIGEYVRYLKLRCVCGRCMFFITCRLDRDDCMPGVVRTVGHCAYASLTPA